MTYNTEWSAWEHVVHFRRKGYGWQKPYLCKCGKYHLTSKHFDGKAPKWVKIQASQQSKKTKNKEDRRRVDKFLPLVEQKKLYAQLHNQPRRWYNPFTW